MPRRYRRWPSHRAWLEGHGLWRPGKVAPQHMPPPQAQAQDVGAAGQQRWARDFVQKLAESHGVTLPLSPENEAARKDFLVALGRRFRD